MYDPNALAFGKKIKGQSPFFIPFIYLVFRNISNFKLTVFIEYSGGLMYAKSFSSLEVQYVSVSVQYMSVSVQ